MSELHAIRRRSLERVQTTPTARDAFAGNLRREHYVNYLINVYHYAQHSPRVIALAGTRCTSTHPALAAYLFRHAQEELGHELWALSDLSEMGVASESVTDSRPVPACAQVCALEYYTARHVSPV